MGNSGTLLINRNLEAFDSTALLRESFASRTRFFKATRATVDPDVALVPVGAFRAGAPYPSAQEGRPEWHLPLYVLRRENGAPVVKLTLDPPSDDPEAPVGRLTLDLQALPPPADHEISRPMRHEIAMRLGYQIPLQDEEASDPAPTPVGPTVVSQDLAGSWENLDPDTTGVAALRVLRRSDSELLVQAQENCPAGRCVLGRAVAQFADGEAMVVFHKAAKTVSLHLSRQGDQLLVAEHVDIHDAQTPGDALFHHVFVARGTAAERPLIWIPLEPPQPVSVTVRRSTTLIRDREAYARLLTVMADPVHAARLELTCVAQVAQRSLRQVFVGSLKTEDFIKATGKKAFVVEKTDATKIRKILAERMVENPADVATDRISFEIKKPAASQPATIAPAALQPGAALRLRGGVTGAASGFRPRAGLVAARGAAAVTAERRSAASLREALSAAAARIREAREAAAAASAVSGAARATRNGATALKFDEIAKAAILDRKLPRHVLVEPTGEPVLTRRRDTAVQVVAPFSFDRAQNPQMFDMPPENPQGLVLLRHEVTAGARRATIYQEGIDGQQFYYEPEEFRLARDDSAPFAPALLFHLAEEVDAEDETEGDEVRFSVVLTYYAAPYLNPALLAAARAEFGPDARFAPINPTIRALTIELPGEGGTAALTLREDAVVDFSDGIRDVVQFGEDDYLRFTRALQTASGVGLEGHVEATLLDGSTTTVPVRISLRDTVGAPFDSAVETVSPALARATLRNRIESPVRIDHVHDVALADGGRATAAAVASADPVAPRGTTTVDYRLEPEGQSTAGLVPLLDTSTVPDVLAILSQTTVVQGYSDRDFQIELAIDPLFFQSTPPGQVPLTAVEVAFRTLEEPVRLTAAEPSLQVTLPMPLLLFITNADSAQHYSYSVTDLHGDTRGASTPFTAGSGNLEVVPAASANGFGGGFG